MALDPYAGPVRYWCYAALSRRRVLPQFSRKLQERMGLPPRLAPTCSSGSTAVCTRGSQGIPLLLLTLANLDATHVRRAPAHQWAKYR